MSARSGKWLATPLARIALAAAILLLLPFVAGICRAQSTEELTICLRDALDGEPDVVLKACTTAIETQKLAEANLRRALTNRGIVYKNKGDYQHAIQDFNHSIALNPNDDKAFNDRGASNMELGDLDHAIAD